MANIRRYIKSKSNPGTKALGPCLSRIHPPQHRIRCAVSRKLSCPLQLLLHGVHQKWILQFNSWVHFLGKLFTVFNLKSYLSLLLRCVSCMQQNDGSCFHIHSVSLCLFIGELSSLILRTINDKQLLLLPFPCCCWWW